MTDRYGPWIVHTPGECPVPPETMVQTQLRDETQIRAEARSPGLAGGWIWEQRGDATIAYYRVLLEPEWVQGAALVYVDGAGAQVTAPIRVPMLDGDFDFTRQPEWEGV